MSTAFLPVRIRILSMVIFKTDPTFHLDSRGFFVCSFLLCSIYSDGSMLNPRGGGLLKLYLDISKFIDQNQQPGLWLEASSLFGLHIPLLHSCFCLRRTVRLLSNFFIINTSFILEKKHPFATRIPLYSHSSIQVLRIMQATLT